ncbi:MAG: M67 family metallopeptidase [Candidatus Omnitrophica bacterium]|nr:M67 family metallopeptidase [Candidatus Omnitrophota bacterium]MBU1128066.1 M67 family metallopeptidase [Candidatus Omnitrophota bacterium]MBU1851065.1 M67 family metallopeptidase [Candidatus Omnitrophota bacterium]
MLKIPRKIVNAIIEQGKREAPLEACGYLAGEDGVISKHYEMTNVDASEEHFSLDPKEQFAAVKGSRSEGLDILAVYHSHPASPARPSNEDIKLAYDPNIVYVIVSLQEENNAVRAFNIKKGIAKEMTVNVKG